MHLLLLTQISFIKRNGDNISPYESTQKPSQKIIIFWMKIEVIIINDKIKKVILIYKKKEVILICWQNKKKIYSSYLPKKKRRSYTHFISQKMLC
jgi:hypothetical protein